MNYLFTDTPPTEIVDTILNDALAKKASDIHLKPEPAGLVIKFRVDGLLNKYGIINKNQASQIIARLKVLARLRTDEHHLPQDGRFPCSAKVSDREPQDFDIRIAITPTHFGEAAILRLLTQQKNYSDFTTLGFSATQAETILKNLRRPSGLILVTGPTGSGKTTTLYTCLQELFRPEISITTIEDPIEYALPGITQIPANNHTGLTFANGLRSILRQDPDVIMVGEIRDQETAKIAINAALTGHLVLSTLHTNNATGTLPRLLDMGIDPYLISATVTLIISQRLIRLSSDGENFDGRSVIAEVLEINEQLQQAITEHASSKVISSIANQTGFTEMIEHGKEKVVTGLTTETELARIIYA